MKYPIIFLDADDTLLDFDRSETCALSDVLRDFGTEPTPMLLQRYKHINRAAWEAFERGEIEKETMLWKRFETFFAQNGISGDPVRANRQYHDRLGGYAFVLPGAEELCRTLRESGRRLYVLTNGTASVQKRRMAASGLLPYLGAVFISEEIGVQKPAAAYFERVFAALGQPSKADCILLGDSQSSDMAGAKGFGIACCWFCPHGGQAKDRWDYQISRLSDFAGILKGASV